MNTNDLAFLWRGSQEKQLEINGNTIRVYPSNFGPGRNFANGVEFEAAIIKALSPSATNLITVSCSPGDYESVSFPNANSYITYITENTALTTGLATGNSGYSIAGNTLTVTSAGGPGDKYDNPQEPYDDVAVEDILGEPTVTSPKYIRYKDIDFAINRVEIASVADATGGDILVTTSTAHGLEADDYVRLEGMSVSGYESDARTAYLVKTAPTDTTFTVEATYSATSTGLSVKQSILITSNSYVGVLVNNVQNLVIL